MEASKGKWVVVSNIQDYIKNFHIKIWPVSSSTIRRILKNHLKMSYRKAENKIRKSFTDEYKRKMLKTIHIVESLKNDGWELIYFDEFNYNPRTYKHYNWDIKGNKNYLIGTSENVTLNFIVAISTCGTYGLLWTESTGDSDFSINFITELWKWRNDNKNLKNKKFVFLMDNSSIHTSIQFCKFLKSAKLREITICPYSPHLNPAEKLIQSIKGKLKRIQAHDK